ncbi:MAG: 30S ribosome-binding factor RbfA [Rickettsiaceae bacterium]|nr:30S ribosome-binding factor RbfA [Rickettsiaceae bacterium]MCP5374693.1 30S ribosome-binding factor RbfA [Rickettsiaceae bacterium]MCP5377752.1 30S ribosome-binding factor RbfA [Rickettsiaceae bacterium]
MSKSKSTFKLKDREKPQSQRQLKVSQIIGAAIIDCLMKGKGVDMRLIPIPLTITKVNITPDLKVANCYFLPFNTKLSEEEILKALEESRYIIRQYVTKEINLKYSPEIRFFYDQAFENAAKIDLLLNKL